MEKKAQTLLRDWLETERRKVGWFATQIPAHPSSVSSWLTGARTPDRNRRLRMAQLTGLDIAEKETWE